MKTNRSTPVLAPLARTSATFLGSSKRIFSEAKNHPPGAELSFDAEHLLQAASAVVANNLKRKGKNLWTPRQGGTEGLVITTRRMARMRHRLPRTTLRNICERQLTRARICGGAAFIARKTRSRPCLKRPMRRYQLKYHVVGGFSFYERAEIKDMISYLKVIHNVDDSISLLRVINTPVRGIGTTH